MDLSGLVQVVPQLALAALFAYVMERREAQAMAERRVRDDEWRDFLGNSTTMTTQALEHIAERMEAHDARLTGVEHVVTAYSVKFDEAISAMRAAVGTRKGDTGPIGQRKE